MQKQQGMLRNLQSAESFAFNNINITDDHTKRYRFFFGLLTQSYDYIICFSASIADTELYSSFGPPIWQESGVQMSQLTRYLSFSYGFLMKL